MNDLNREEPSRYVSLFIFVTLNARRRAQLNYESVVRLFPNERVKANKAMLDELFAIKFSIGTERPGKALSFSLSL